MDQLLVEPLHKNSRFFTYSRDGDQSGTDSITYVVLDTVHGLTQSAIDELIEIQSAVSGDLTETYEWKICNIEAAQQSGRVSSELGQVLIAVYIAIADLYERWPSECEDPQGPFR